MSDKSIPSCFPLTTACPGRNFSHALSGVMQAVPAESKTGAGLTPPAGSNVNEALAEALDRQTAVGSLCRVEGERIRCVACGHRCLLAPGRRGICRVRFNRDGQLLVPFGYVAGVQSDPVEK